MNLVLSGPIDPALLDDIRQWSRPSSVKPLRESAWRLEDVDDSLVNRQTVAARCDAAMVDHAFVGPDFRLRNIKLLAMDMDSTLITIECIDELADFAGRRKEVEAITAATMRGEIVDFAESLRRRVALLEGLPCEALEQVYVQRVQLSIGAGSLISAAHANDVYLLLVSGGFSFFADRLGEFLHFDATFANNLQTFGGRLTGQLKGKVVDGAEKEYRVKNAMKATHCSSFAALVIGDGAHDIPMMKCVSHSIAYRAKPVVTDVASVSVKFGTLETALDFLA